jgi:hypothetical protein
MFCESVTCGVGVSLTLTSLFFGSIHCIVFWCLEEYLILEGMKRWEAGGNCIVKNSVICTFDQILGQYIKEDEMGRACRLYGE